jgi:hypothetical protein
MQYRYWTFLGVEHILFIKERFHVGGVNHAETIYYLSHDDGCRWPDRLLYAVRPAHRNPMLFQLKQLAAKEVHRKRQSE